MKNKTFNLLFNPFTRIAGWQAFGIGLIVLIITGLIGANSAVAFDGVLDMHLFEITYFQSFAYLILSLASLVLVMWITGLIQSKGFRFIDILGTMTLAKGPNLILSIAGFFTTVPNLDNIQNDPLAIFQNVSFVLMLVLSMVVMIWNITLMYQGLKISCNLNGSKLTVAFIIALLASEILSKALIFKLI